MLSCSCKVRQKSAKMALVDRLKHVISRLGLLYGANLPGSSFLFQSFFGVIKVLIKIWMIPEATECARKAVKLQHSLISCYVVYIQLKQ